MKATDHNGNGFQCLLNKFGNTKCQSKSMNFVAPEICELMRDTSLRSRMESLELAALDAFVLVVQNFFGNHRKLRWTREHVRSIRATRLPNVTEKALPMFFPKIFLTNMGNVNDEFEERFHQDISFTEMRDQGHCCPVRWSTTAAVSSGHSRAQKQAPTALFNSIHVYGTTE